MPHSSSTSSRRGFYSALNLTLLYRRSLSSVSGCACDCQASVRYVLRVKLDSTNASLRQMCRDCGFVVSRPLDLNQISPLDAGTPRHWTSAAAAFVDEQLPPVEVSDPTPVTR